MENDNNSILNHTITYDQSILNKEGDIIQNIGLNIIYPDNSAVIGSIDKQFNNSNFEVGDRVLSVNDIEIESWRDLVFFIQNNPNTNINVLANRNGKL